MGAFGPKRRKYALGSARNAESCDDRLGRELLAQLLEVDRGEILIELAAAVEVDVLSGYRGDALEHLCAV